MTIQLPTVYCDFINMNGLFEGFAVASGEEHYVALWGEDEAASANAELEVCVYAPGFVAFAGNGGGEIYAFDGTGAVVRLPMIGMAPETAIRLTSSFREFSQGFQHERASGK